MMGRTGLLSSLVLLVASLVYGASGTSFNATTMPAGDVRSNEAVTWTSPGEHSVNGNMDVKGNMHVATGSLASPAFSWDADPDTGLYSSQSGEVGVVSNGSAVGYFGTSAVSFLNPVWLKYSGTYYRVCAGNSGPRLELCADSNWDSCGMWDGNSQFGILVENDKTTVNGVVVIGTMTATYTNGSAYVCVRDSGEIFFSESACP